MRAYAGKTKAFQPVTGQAQTGLKGSAVSLPRAHHAVEGRSTSSSFNDGSKDTLEGSTTIEIPRFGHDFSRLRIYPETRAGMGGAGWHGTHLTAGTSMDSDNGRHFQVIQGKSPDKPGAKPRKPGAPAPKKAGKPAPAGPKKKAGVDSFIVKWTIHPDSGPTIAKFHLDYWAKFKKDAQHDPALAEFRQNAGYDFKITAGPNGGFGSTGPLQDDGYSRADGFGGYTLQDVDFYSNDNPGTARGIRVHKNDVLDFTFTAEQMIIDTGQGNDWDGYKEIAKLGPHTATIQGRHPRTYKGVPVILH